VFIRPYRESDHDAVGEICALTADSMLTTNTPARAFYDRLGFHEIDVPNSEPLTYLGLQVGPNACLGDAAAG
jgi:hypothetical protein